MGTLTQDLKFALRMLVKNPGLTLAVMIVLAFSIGVNTTIFSVVSAVLVRPLPYKDPARIVMIWETDVRRMLTRGIVSPANYIDWKEQSQSFETLSPWRFWYFNLTGVGEPERVQGLLVGANFFDLLGVKPEIGRTFDPENEQAGNDRVVVLSHNLWERRFGADPGVLDKTVMIEGENYRVIGVLPASFRFMKVLNRDLDIWVPLVIEPRQVSRQDHSINVFGRLKQDVSLQQARSEMDGIMSRIEQQYPATNTGRGARVVPLQENYGERIHDTLLILLAAVGFVLLIACANVANLLLARATVRQKEMAVRSALGADRIRLVRQVLTESVVLALIGGLLGVLLAYSGVSLLNDFIPNSVVARVDSFKVDGRVLAYTSLVSILTGLLFGVAPGLQSSRYDLVEVLKEGARGSTGFRGGRLRNLLVGLEVALAVMLLIGAGLMIRSSLQLQQFDRGFRSANILTGQVSLPKPKYPQNQQLTQFYREALERLHSTPGLQSASIVNFLPLSGLSDNVSFTVEGRTPPPESERPSARYYVVGPDYFQTMGMTILRGREITDQDAAGSPGAVVINQTMAQLNWPQEDPIGQRIKLAFPKAAAPWRPELSTDSLAVVGIVRDAREDGLVNGPIPQMYLSYLQGPSLLMNFVLRSGSEPARMAGALRSSVMSADPDQPVFNIKTMDELVAESFAQPSVLSLLLGTFAALAFILAVVGIYGVMAYSVTQRTHELGVRMALGAKRGDVLRLVLASGAKLILAGVAVGLAGALVANRLVATLLFGVSSTDPATFVAVALLLSAVAMIATYLPAHKATRVEPVIALRHE
ncbi:MAG TPA: ABC transporter permease [Blastocatellia bacterium]|nr:ABC transporter permease [Blastocatellia bacterium]